jgi:hypothetical protein
VPGSTFGVFGLIGISGGPRVVLRSLKHLGHHLIYVSLDLLSQSSLDLLVEVVLLTEFTGEFVRFVFFAPKNDYAFSGLIVAEVYCDPDNFVGGLVC